ncbi:metallophosphoesterase [Thioalkalivibrio thiocyanodenitrificans]|uniref:metallophosphoesterase n=1 Tax=Thioalkalivibrio thiocyanodenitrificans TaxID=243063 RepID=UPI0003727850|nr:metallophosphoesterase [Thioalkalivibrio thiocyanodenitrificans]
MIEPYKLTTPRSMSNAQTSRLRLRLLSDIHQEIHGRFEVVPHEEDAESVLVLPGDLHNPHDLIGWLIGLSYRFRALVVVPGNHDYYDVVMGEIEQRWVEALAKAGISNVHLLCPGAATIDHVRFIGATLWTDLRNADPLLCLDVQKILDFRRILVQTPRGRRPLTVDHWLSTHAAHAEYLEAELRKPHPGPTVVVSHHLPCEQVSEEHRRAQRLQGAWACSRLEPLIHEHRPALWCFGHTHNPVNMQIEGTRMLANPLGYVRIGEGLRFDDDLAIHL